MKPVLIVQNCAAESAGTIIDYMSLKRIPHELVKSFDSTLPNIDEVSGAICLGCPISVTEYQKHGYLKTLYGFVAEAVRDDLPYLGICFGGQLLAKVLGAEVSPNRVKEIGVHSVTLTADGTNDPVLSGFPDDFPVTQWHSDTFKIPFGRKLLVEGNDCRNQMFRNSRQVATQFHLETTEAMLADWCDTYPDELAEVGKSRAQVVAEYRPVADTIKTMNSLFLDNFFALSKDNQPTSHRSGAHPHRA